MVVMQIEWSITNPLLFQSYQYVFTGAEDYRLSDDSGMTGPLRRVVSHGPSIFLLTTSSCVKV